MAALPPVVAVAASGGRDSTALLHATSRAAATLGVEVHALHVHHGLQPEADDWLLKVQAQCRRWRRSGLPLRFHSHRLQGAPAAGESVEAWARRERYLALAEMAKVAGSAIVLLAQHRRDQAETFLLQAMRSGGPASLAAMPAAILRDGILWLRPWLNQPRESIEAYLRLYRLAWIDDSSNGNHRFARNRLRLEVWPALARSFPDAEVSIAGAARRAQEAAACLGELAAMDLAATTAGAVLHLRPWTALSVVRRSHLLRVWLGATMHAAVPETLVQRLSRELPGAHVGRWPAPGGELRLHDGRLRFATALAPVLGVPAAPGPYWLELNRPGRYQLPGWNGEIQVETSLLDGVKPADLTHVELRPRGDGERFQSASSGLPRSLKKQYQARRVPAWHRDGPLLYSDNRLLFVPGLGIDARRLGAPGGLLLQLRWLPTEPVGGAA